MAQKTVGYVELEWVCPNCGSRNKGSEKMCAGCGAAQPPDVKFEQPAEEKLIAAEDNPAPAIPDVHCPFCGIRNPGAAKVCLKCGGDLSGAQKREAGQVLGAHRSEAAAPVVCPACGENNSAANLRCARCGAPLPQANPTPPAPAATAVPPRRAGIPWLFIGLGVLGLIVVVVIISALTSRRDVSAEVIERAWSRSIQIEQYGPVNQQDWEEDLPSAAKNIKCADKYQRTGSQPAAKSTEVCGTPYTVDQGDGSGKVVQDCEYEIYASYCQYSVDAWTPARLETLNGSNSEPPIWPAPSLKSNQRTGDTSEQYTITFDLDGDQMQYQTQDVDLFLNAQAGSRWILTLNGLGAVVDIAPVQ